MPRTFEAQQFFEAVYLAVQRVPEGKVTSYGAIARLIGRPDCPRQVGTALKHLPDQADLGAAAGQVFHSGNVPWQRVINSRGAVSPRGYPGGADRQATALEREGVRLVRRDEGWVLEDSERWWNPPSESDDEDDESVSIKDEDDEN